MTKERRRIGEIFVSNGLITQKTLDRALARSRRLGRKLGFVLEDMDVVTDMELANALAYQHGHKVVRDFARLKLPSELLQLVSVDVAMQHLLFPLKRDKDTLILAMADPTDMRIASNIGVNNGLTVTPVVATRRDILDAINRHYLGKPPSYPDEKTVLLAEDDKLISTIVGNILKGAGYQVLIATDGMEAYKMALSEHPHVIISDKEMPKLGGYALLDSLKNLPETHATPILLLTATNDAEEEASAFEKGFFDFLSKPVREATLLARVKRAFQVLGFSFEEEVKRGSVA